MSQRLKIENNPNDSKNTRLEIAKEFAGYRFSRDALAHVSRYRLICQRLIDMAKNTGAPLRVLDIGCGDIYIARTLQASFQVKKADIIERYVGFDIDYKCLDAAKKNTPKSFPVELVQGDVTRDDLKGFKDKEFDVVICLETIEHIKPGFVPGLLKEIKRLGFYAYISTPNIDGGTGNIPDDHIKEWGYNELAREIERAGLKPNEEIGTFCNLKQVKAEMKKNKTLKNIYEYLDGKMDDDFLSITMARFMGRKAQNILWVCKC